MNLLAQVGANQGVVHQQQAVGHRRTQAVDELQRRRASAAFPAIDHDKVRMLTGFQHGLDDAKPFPRMTYRQLEAHRLATGQGA